MAQAQYVFFIGTGRMGSTFLVDYIGRNLSGCLAEHQPNRMIKILSNRFVSRKTRAEKMRDYLRSWRDRRQALLNTRKLNVYVQSDPWLFGFTPWLEEVFGMPYVIHVVRHPLTYIPSQLNRFYREAWSGFMRNLIPYWRLRGDLTGDFTRGEWKESNEEIKTAWNWVKINQFIDENRKGIAHFLRVRSEDMFSHDREGLKQIIDFCGFPVDPDVIEEPTRDADRNFSVNKFPSADEWAEKTTQAVVEICRPMMDVLGYRAF
jgi:hypothetical protein